MKQRPVHSHREWRVHLLTFLVLNNGYLFQSIKVFSEKNATMFSRKPFLGSKWAMRNFFLFYLYLFSSSKLNFLGIALTRKVLANAICFNEKKCYFCWLTACFYVSSGYFLYFANFFLIILMLVSIFLQTFKLISVLFS